MHPRSTVCHLILINSEIPQICGGENSARGIQAKAVCCHSAIPPFIVMSQKRAQKAQPRQHHRAYRSTGMVCGVRGVQEAAGCQRPSLACRKRRARVWGVVGRGERQPFKRVRNHSHHRTHSRRRGMPHRLACRSFLQAAFITFGARRLNNAYAACRKATPQRHHALHRKVPPPSPRLPIFRQDILTNARH